MFWRQNQSKSEKTFSSPKNSKIRHFSSSFNKTGLQPVSRPVEQILGFFPKGFERDHTQKVLNRCKNLKRCTKRCKQRPIGAFGAAKPVTKLIFL